jgi:NADPH-dependent curcumin reductase CurA
MAVSLFGATGLAAYFGLLKVGEPKDGETVVISGAAGATGSVAGMIAKSMGCRVIGIAGGAEKCARVVEEFGFDACVDYKSDDLKIAFKEAVGKGGVDVYFDNVGGDHLQAALHALKVYGRVALCGAISVYNNTEPAPGPNNLAMAIGKQLTMRGFIVFDDFGHLYPEFAQQVGDWVTQGKIKYREEMIDGLEQAPAAFVGLLKGEAFGKRVIKLSV